MARKRRGGPRQGSGRRPTSSEGVRRNRVVVMLTDPEYERLRRMAEGRELPLGTVAYGFVARGLGRRRGTRG